MRLPSSNQQHTGRFCSCLAAPQSLRERFQIRNMDEASGTEFAGWQFTAPNEALDETFGDREPSRDGFDVKQQRRDAVVIHRARHAHVNQPQHQPSRAEQWILA